MNEVYAWLSRSANPVSLRVTVVRYDEDADRHIGIWSRGAGGRPNLTQEQIDDYLSDQVPIMADASTAIVIETWTTYSPIMEFGLGETLIHNLVVTSPRFTEQLMFAGVGDGSGSDHDDGTGGVPNL